MMEMKIKIMMVNQVKMKDSLTHLHSRRCQISKVKSFKLLEKAQIISRMMMMLLIQRYSKVICQLRNQRENELKTKRWFFRTKENKRN